MHPKEKRKLINGFEISFLTSCTLFNFEWFVITILGIVIFFKTIFWQWHIIFRNKVVIFYTALMIFYQIFFLFQWNSSMLRRSRRRHYIWRFCSTPTERRDWRIKTKTKNIVAKKIFDKKNYFIAISSLLLDFLT